MDARRGQRMKAGDHLRSARGAYSHHGIYVGRGRVVHYAGLADAMVKSGPIAEVSLDEFAQGHRVHVVAHKTRRHTRAETVARARSRIGEASYGIADNNCEHFVAWCIDGEHDSEQVNRGMRMGQAALATAVSGGALIAAGSAASGLAGGAQLLSGLATVGGALGAGALGGVATVAGGPAIVASAVMGRVVLPDGDHLDEGERAARKAGRLASAAGGALGTAGAVGAVAALSGGASTAAITGGLGALGLGGGVVAGVAVAAAAPVVLAAGAGYAVYEGYKWLRS